MCINLLIYLTSNILMKLPIKILILSFSHFPLLFGLAFYIWIISPTTMLLSRVTAFQACSSFTFFRFQIFFKTPYSSQKIQVWATSWLPLGASSVLWKIIWLLIIIHWEDGEQSVSVVKPKKFVAWEKFK